ncbi:protein CD300H-like isoform X2 [Chanodichthys erythropterus]|uniref:protein CD300H-like isoform X2 n=1 Tax=Chanodichthys erythropterus TaxID=933992 RepID=UPI00351E42E9
MWDVLLLFSSICTAVVVGAPVTVTGHRGERVEIRCSYESGYESNSKYFCKGECIIGIKNIMVKSGSPAKDERFSLTDDKKNRVFTVTITDLRTEDEGLYWCAVERTLTSDLSLSDLYSEILLQVKQDKKTTEVSTISPFSKTSSSYFSTTPLNPQSVSIGLLPLNTTAKNAAEDIDWNDHNYQEISEFQCKNKDISTIYTTAESPDDPMIYSTADAPDDPMIYYTADKPDDFTIYSTADKPNSTVYSTVDKPVSTIYSKAESPDDPKIFSTSESPMIQ